VARSIRTEDIEFHQELRDSYRQIAAVEPQRCVLERRHETPGRGCAVYGPALRERFFRASVDHRGQSGMSAVRSSRQLPSSSREPGAGGASRRRDGLADASAAGGIQHALADRGRARHGKATLAIGWRVDSPIAIPWRADVQTPRRCRLIHPIRSAPCGRVPWGRLLTLNAAQRQGGSDRHQRLTKPARYLFFGSTGAVEGWRVCIVAPFDESSQRRHALFKILREPRGNSLFCS